MDASLSTSTDFYAGANQPAAASTYMWTPLVVLAAGILVLVFVLAFLMRAEQRNPIDTERSFFD